MHDVVDLVNEAFSHLFVLEICVCFHLLDFSFYFALHIVDIFEIVLE
jgi:hypothetical protein